jgi:hypothetical protein
MFWSTKSSEITLELTLYLIFCVQNVDESHFFILLRDTTKMNLKSMVKIEAKCLDYVKK